MKEKVEVLGIDYVILRGAGGRDRTNGASVEEDDLMHLSRDIGRTTVCEKSVQDFLLTYADVKINCPECIKVIKGIKVIKRKKS